MTLFATDKKVDGELIVLNFIMSELSVGSVPRCSAGIPCAW